jgi:hypothetical protein
MDLPEDSQETLVSAPGVSSLGSTPTEAGRCGVVGQVAVEPLFEQSCD